MARPGPTLVIDARPRGSRGPMAAERVLGRPVLAHLIDLAGPLGAGSIVVYARVDELGMIRAMLADPPAGIEFRIGPPPEGAVVVRADRLYDPDRLRRAVRRGRDPESAVVWRLDGPHALAGAADELARRRTYQPLGRFWALAPARGLAQILRPTFVRPNAVTIASGTLMLLASGVVAWGGAGPLVRLLAGSALALALILDTADGHLARLQGTASAFGRWLDGVLDEWGDMMLHAGIAWSAFARDGRAVWLLLGMLYGMGKYLFVVGNAAAEARSSTTPAPPTIVEADRGVVRLVRLAGHADVRWHLWIVLAAIGRLEMALAAYAIYFPVRAVAAAARKVMRHG